MPWKEQQGKENNSSIKLSKVIPFFSPKPILLLLPYDFSLLYLKISIVHILFDSLQYFMLLFYFIKCKFISKAHSNCFHPHWSTFSSQLHHFTLSIHLQTFFFFCTLHQNILSHNLPILLIVSNHLHIQTRKPSFSLLLLKSNFHSPQPHLFFISYNFYSELINFYSLHNNMKRLPYPYFPVCWMNIGILNNYKGTNALSLQVTSLHHFC